MPRDKTKSQGDLLQHQSDSERGQVLAQLEDRLESLETERVQILAQVAAIRLQLTAAAQAVQPRPPEVPTLDAALSTDDKVKLYARLFRGRPDVYPTRFESKKTGNTGYAPACTNKFVAGVCELPKVKCGDCTRQAFLPADHAAIVAHLKGQHVMGAYPMLENETCWFLAVDFDKGSWRDDVRAFVNTCQKLGLPRAVERSRSGNGAHVWFFFSAPVAAALARKWAVTSSLRRWPVAMS